MHSRSKLALLSALAMGGALHAQSRTPPVATYPAMTEFPKENKAVAAEYLARARAAAGDDLFGDFVHRCIADPRFRQRVNALQMNALLPPAKVFDQLYFVGQNAESAWALDTTEGIVLFDALENEEQAREIIVPGLKTVGLDPARLRYIVITHAHGDHYGGAEFLRKTYGAALISSAPDWAAMDAMRARGRAEGPEGVPMPPARIEGKDRTIADGEALKLGGTTLHFYVTPGHTAGTVSTIFDVTDHGKRHVAAFFGGFGAPRDPLLRYTHIASMRRFADLAAKAGADIMLANHPVQDGAFEKLELLRYRRAGDANPFVVGPDKLARYYKVQETCSRLGLVRAGLDPEKR
ncbi:metallo-beta-lactamase class B [Novosphingobium sp. SG751A]|uniref:MBL fold metallo-hydrolase n=1 Tax=Novosphingobium sp. SG751A TaxID=2587000 RepID=UPI00155607D1|nr:MBL fold metallo-hydrolase [Novosphingobium sp. SG751A]NOW47517.1 metallo-beta-lactamase class B [Novosphingobium sp. SG751A]